MTQCMQDNVSQADVTNIDTLRLFHLCISSNDCKIPNIT